MSIFRYDVFGISSNGTIYEFVIVFVLFYQMKMKVGIDKLYKRRIYNNLNDI